MVKTFYRIEVQINRTAFEKDVYKLMNNAIVGKTMEDVEKHMEYELVVN